MQMNPNPVCPAVRRAAPAAALAISDACMGCPLACTRIRPAPAGVATKLVAPTAKTEVTWHAGGKAGTDVGASGGGGDSGDSDFDIDDDNSDLDFSDEDDEGGAAAAPVGGSGATGAVGKHKAEIEELEKKIAEKNKAIKKAKAKALKKRLKGERKKLLERRAALVKDGGA